MKYDTVHAIDVNIIFFRNAAPLYNLASPAGATAGSAGFDLRADIAQENGGEISIAPGERYMINSGIAIEPLSPCIAGFIYSRSGLGAVTGLTVAQGVGLIDPDYRGEIKIALLNTSREAHTVKRGDRIAQLVFQPFYAANFIQVGELGATVRGAGGFGHTGRQ